jgi:formate/nitrite transporter FocA (FNT family)
MITEDEEKRQQPQKSYRTILSQEIEAGLEELKRPASGLFLSSLSAGLDIGFSLLLMASMLTLLAGSVSDAVIRVALANMYSIGFMLVILGRSELFTEHTALAVMPVLDRRASIFELMRVWVLVFLGNITGTVIFSIITAWVGPRFGIIEPWAFSRIAGGLLGHSWFLTFMSALLAGWLMGELGWLLAAGRDTISQVFFVWLITTAIGFLNLHHSIAGTVEVLCGVFVDPAITYMDFGRFLFLSTVGNTFGGVIFVALIKYGHAIRARDADG